MKCSVLLKDLLPLAAGATDGTSVVLGSGGGGVWGEGGAGGGEEKLAPSRPKMKRIYPPTPGASKAVLAAARKLREKEVISLSCVSR